jgi:L-ascorbate 6-phosphate lactonase
MTSTPESPNLEQQIRDLVVAPGHVAVVWLGQAGYVLKTPEGVIVMIDPYLSEYALDTWGMKRILPAPIDPDLLKPDVLLVTHWHEDHLDMPTVKRWIKNDPGLLIGSSISCVRSIAWGWPDSQVVELNVGESYQHLDLQVTGTFARHDVDVSPAPDAIGFLIEIGNIKIWNVGDTEYDARLRPLREEEVDIAIVPINGVGGNLDVDEAAFLMWKVQPKIAIPMHYNMWSAETFGPGATLDPQDFVALLKKLGAGFETRILDVGEIALFASRWE